MARKPRPGFTIGDHTLAAGTRATVDLPVSILPDHTPVTLSAHVVHGQRDGPVMFVSAAVHGDEVIGVEIVRRLLRTPNLDRLAGTLIAVPIVNTFGFLNHSRYLPDRVGPGIAGGAPGQHVPDRDRRALRFRHRPAFGRHPAHQPAANPHQPR
jgi:predicted deacylase